MFGKDRGEFKDVVQTPCVFVDGTFKKKIILIIVTIMVTAYYARHTVAVVLSCPVHLVSCVPSPP